jgi:multicomponent Na+:H+ antiporter subunit E
LTIFVPALLVALWLLAWGHITVANVVSGIAVAAVLLIAFPSDRRGRPRIRVHLLAVGRLLLYVMGQLVISNVLVAREILSRRSRIRTGVIAYRVEHPSDAVLTLIVNIVALSPGTMTVDVTRDPPIIYVHFLLLSDVDEARRAIARLERLVFAAIGDPHRGTEPTVVTRDDTR